jgi:hypothetical protein
MGPAGIESAHRLLAGGDAKGAKRACEGVLATSSAAEEIAAAHRILAVCCRREQNGVAALAHARAAVALAPASAEGHYVLAEELDNGGNKVEAIDCLRRAIAARRSGRQRVRRALLRHSDGRPGTQQGPQRAERGPSGV